MHPDAIACDPSAISRDQRQRWVDTVKELYKQVQEVREVPDGYALRLPPELLLLAAEEVDFERLCCPWMRYSLDIEPHHGPLWLRITGGSSIKDALRLGFESTDLLVPEVATAAGLNVAHVAHLDSVDTVLRAIDSLNETISAWAGMGASAESV